MDTESCLPPSLPTCHRGFERSCALPMRCIAFPTHEMYQSHSMFLRLITWKCITVLSLANYFATALLQSKHCASPGEGRAQSDNTSQKDKKGCFQLT